jgi:TolA-binding protein
MLRHCASIKLSVALMLTLAVLFAGSAFGQSPAARPDRRQKELPAAQESRLSNPDTPASEPTPIRPENKIAAEEPRPNDLPGEVETLKAENIAVREQLRRMEEQQKALLDLVERMQRRLDGAASADVQPNGAAQATPQVADAAAPLKETANGAAQPTNAGNASAQQAPVAKQEKEDRYQDGIIIYQNSDDAKVPFLLKFNNNTQIRYLNTLNSNDTFTDHLGVVRDVHRRNDITVNRSMFIFAGYMFDKRLQYSLTVWTSAGAASIVVAGNIGWRFSKKLTLTGGYTGVPGSRSLVNTFPFFQPTDRSMADNFFRPGFTQGLWANGEPLKGLNYLVFVGNGLNTLNISANKIDTSLLLSGSVWWEPLGAYSEPGKSRQMYDDYFASKKTRIRIGTSFTRSREDRFSELDQSSPDNTSIYNSDGVLAFSTGAFAPGVTLQKATYKMWAVDGGLKKNGFSVNGQYYLRWLSDFEADGALPLSSTFDHGFELSAGKFIVPKKLLLYARGSKVFGQFANPYEYAGGFKWYLLPTERVWLTGELMRVQKAPYGGAFTPYTAGMTGWVPMVQTVLAF